MKAALAVLLAGTALAAQSERLTFEVASVKPNTTIDGRVGVTLSPSGQVTLTRFSLRDLIWMSYGGMGVADIQGPDQIVGGPSWLATDHFDIAARADGDVLPNNGRRSDRLMAMIRSLLEDRFAVRVRVEHRQTQIYTLVLANKDGRLGPAIHPTTHDCPKEATCGVRTRGGTVTAIGQTMQDIATAFPNFSMVDRPAYDGTGLSGRFDFQLQYTPPPPPADPNADARPSVDFIGSFLTAVREQLGLKLRREQGTADYLVIDHAERPAPD